MRVSVVMATAYEAHERRASDSGLRAPRLTEFSKAPFPELRPPLLCDARLLLPQAICGCDRDGAVSNDGRFTPRERSWMSPLPDQCDQDDDGNRNSEQPQQGRTHDCLLIRSSRAQMNRAVVRRTWRRGSPRMRPRTRTRPATTRAPPEALRASSATCFALAFACSRFCFSRVNVSVTRCSASAGVIPVFEATSWPRYRRSDSSS